MSSRAITEEMYDQMLVAFREHGPDFATVSRLVGVQSKTAKRAYNLGWPARKGGSWSTPMKVILDREKVEARAKLAEQGPLPQPIEDRARADAAQQLAESITMVRNVRKAANACLGIVATMVPATLELARGLAEDVKNKKLDGETAIRVVQRVIKMAGVVAQVSDTAQIMEHREAGKPTDILALAGVADTGPMTMEEAERELEAATNALRRAKEIGMVLPGAQVQPAADKMPN